MKMILSQEVHSFCVRDLELFCSGGGPVDLGVGGDV